MRHFANTLSEIDRRAYAAIEAYKLGHGGVSIISRLLEISPETIKRGQRDLDSPERLPQGGRLRHKGAGRPGICAEQPGLADALEGLLENRIAGDPMNEDIKWTDLQPSTIVTKLAQQGYSITENTVRALLKKRTSANAKR
jgi:Rhodopirellula transposase DDE domain